MTGAGDSDVMRNTHDDVTPHLQAPYRRLVHVPVDLERSALAAAFDEAAVDLDGRTLLEALVERQWEIPSELTLEALQSLIGLACRQTGETPRALLQAELDRAPSDELWRCEIELE